jgi:hypothetical protein
LVDTVLRVRRRRAVNKTAEAALRYATLGWAVCPGEFRPAAGQRAGDRQRACSCDRIGCPAPGAHPVSPAWQSVATSDSELINAWWLATPTANVILVTGRIFDVLDVPGSVGLTALARMERSGLRPGPVAMSTVAVSTEERAHFFVRSRGAPADETEWWSCHLDCEPEEIADVAGLRWHCRNSYVVAPPSVTGTGAACRWLRDPLTHELPDGLRLLEILSDVCEEARSW